MKYVVSHALPDKQDASVKAHTDIDRFLSAEGFKTLTFATRSGNNKLSRQFNRLRSISNLAKIVQPADTLVVQYPIYSSDLDTDRFYQRVIVQAAHKIAIVHDLPFLRDSFPPVESDLKKEVARLNLFDVVIVHNEAMKQKLSEVGLKARIVILGLFDYYSPTINEQPHTKAISGKILFAGNLTKSKFVTSLKSDKLVQYHLWGGIADESALDASVDYHGIVPSDELPQYLTNGWGLVWDGEATDSVTGLGGEYLRYIDPHKTSLYISAGVPVIVWKKAGVAKFIEDNNLGMAIDSIDEIPERIQNLSQQQYAAIMDSVQNMQQRLIDGSMIKTAVRAAEKNQ
ncbi:hypothetical protein [Loigolactobacillus jiayinensis]|uniref:Beta-1,6-galactofuranosyltransferase n=1 Tax=Loigolactobacillus jiayinensis TaxID=2486016 RepID=A0ABW1RBP7_9LACO|nr:hypothetical protein [Loigolactobacillus jiayinensis]